MLLVHISGYTPYAPEERYFYVIILFIKEMALTLAPYLFSGIILEYYIGCLKTFDQYQSFYIIGMILKLPLYFSMRCAENQPDFFLNRFEYFLIIKKYEWFLK